MSKGMWEMVVSILPVIVGLLIAAGVWLNAEVYALKFSALDADDGRRIKAEAVEHADSHYELLLSEINRLRESVDHLTKAQAETLAEVRVLKERI